MRDITAYIIVMSTVVIIALDGKVYLLEAVLLPMAYILYILIIVVINYLQVLLCNIKVPYFRYND